MMISLRMGWVGQGRGVVRVLRGQWVLGGGGKGLFLVVRGMLGTMIDVRYFAAMTCVDF
jgi:hypothetical protein